MAGWKRQQDNAVRWEGALQADSFQGDGSKLTNVGSAGPPGTILWASSAEIIFPISSNQTIRGAGLIATGTVSGATIYGANVTTGVDPGHTHTAYLSSETDPIWIAASSAVHSNIATVSGAYTTHAADTTDPHGSFISQSDISIGSGAITDDGDALSGALIQNIVIGTGDTPPTASNFTRGTIYVEYTP